MADVKRIDIGFQGGQMIAVRAAGDAMDKLVQALEDGAAARWHTLETQDSAVLLDLSQVVYVQREGGDHKVGF